MRKDVVMVRWMLVMVALCVPVWAASMTVDADKLEVNRAAGKAVFTGNVVVVRPDMKLTCARLEGDFGKESLVSIVATGGVVISRVEDGQTETAKGSRADYNPKTGVVVMTGGVTLIHGGHTLTGDRLEYDVKAGKARMTSTNRVRATMADEGK